ncbi:MAG: hypothetical protein OHK0012_13670 [Synechococcales cyanobacterium]
MTAWMIVAPMIMAPMTVTQMTMAHLTSLMTLVLRSPGEFIFRLPESWSVLGGFGLRWYGLSMTVAVVIGFFLSQYLAERQKLEPEAGQAAMQVESLALGLVLGGFAGARAYYVLSHWSEFAANPWNAFAIWQGGIIIHGGLIAGGLFLFLYARKTGINAWAYADILTPGLILGQAIGRLGNFFNAEAYGAPIAPESAWPIREYIPPAMRVFDPSRSLDLRQFEYYHPIFLYEMVLNLILFAILMTLFFRAPKLKTGTWVWIYVIGYSLIRIPYEILRVSAVAYIGTTSIKVAYVASAIGILLGIGALVYMYRFRFDPDLSALRQQLVQEGTLEPDVAQAIVDRAWTIQKRYRHLPLSEKIALAMPQFPLAVAQSRSVQDREKLLETIFVALSPSSLSAAGS